MARVQLPESRLRQRRRRRRVVAVVAVVLAVAALLGGLVWLSHASFLKIKTVSIVGAETLSSTTLQALVKETLTGNYLFLFAKDNIFLYPKKHIEATLLTKNSTLKSVDIKASTFDTVLVTVVERQPKALWCDGNCFLLDEDGVVYAVAPNSSDLHYISYVGSTTAQTVPRQFLTPKEFLALSALVEALAQKVTDDRLRTAMVDEHRDVRVRFMSGFEILFTLDEAAGDIFERFTLALTADPFVSKKLSDFSYLDLRFGDKLYYKLK